MSKNIRDDFSSNHSRSKVTDLKHHMKICLRDDSEYFAGMSNKSEIPGHYKNSF